MSGKWTKGPWQVGRGPLSGQLCVWGPGDPDKEAIWICGQLVNQVINPAGEHNARLIAAGPTMAEALESAPVASMYHGASGFDLERFLADYDAWSTTKRAALSLARGEQ